MKYLMSLGNVSVLECERVITRLHHQLAGIKKPAGVGGEGDLQMLGINYQNCSIPLAQALYYHPKFNQIPPKRPLHYILHM